MKPNQTTDKELSLWLGKVLQKEPYKHDFQDSVGYLDGEYLQRCSKCGNRTDSHKTMTALSVQLAELRKQQCPIPDPIPLDWPNAKKHQWAIIKEMGEIVFMEALGDIYTVSESCTKITCDFESWLILHAQPRDYLQAAAELKEKQK